MIKSLNDNKDYKLLKLENSLEIILIKDKFSLQNFIYLSFLIGYFNENNNEKGFVEIFKEIIIIKIYEKINKEKIKIKSKISEEKINFYFEFYNNELLYEILIIISNVLNKEKFLEIINNFKNEEIESLYKNILVNRRFNYNYVFYKFFNNQTNNYFKDMNILKEYFIIFINNNISSKNIKIIIYNNQDFNENENLIKKTEFNKILNINPIFNINNNKINIFENENNFLILNSFFSTEKINLKIIIKISNKNISNEYFPQFCKYLLYLVKGKKPGSLFYDFYNKKLIYDLKIYSKNYLNNENYIIFKYKVRNLSNNIIRYIFSETINYFKLFLFDRSKNIETTLKDFKNILKNKFNFMNFSNKIKFFSNLTNNLFLLENNNKEKILNKNYFFFDFSDEIRLKIIEIIKEIISLKFIKVILVLPQKEFKFIFNNQKYILEYFSDLKQSENLYFTKFNENNLILLNNITFHYDKSLFLPKYLNNYSSDLNFEKTNKNYLINKKPTLILNLPSINFWYKFDNINEIDYEIISYLHFIFPNLRNNENNLQYSINQKFINHLIFNVYKEFDETFYSKNKIKFNFNEDGLFITLISFKDVYLKILEKIFDFIFNQKTLIEYNNIDYESAFYKNLKEKSLIYLESVLKENNIINFSDYEYKEKNDNISVYKVLDFIKNIKENNIINCFFYGKLDEKFLNEIKMFLMKYKSDGLENLNKIFNELYKNKIIENNTVHIYKIQKVFYENDFNYFINFYQILDKNDVDIEIITFLITKIFNNYFNKTENIFGNYFKLKKVSKNNFIYILTIMNSKYYFPENLSFKFNKLIYNFYEQFENFISKKILKEITFKYYIKLIDKNNNNNKFVSKKLWLNIINRNYNFNIINNIIDKIKFYLDNIKILYDKILFFIKYNFIEFPKKIEFWLYYNNENLNKNKIILEQTFKYFPNLNKIIHFNKEPI